MEERILLMNYYEEANARSHDTDAYGVSGERVNSWDLFRENELLSEKYGEEDE